MLDCAHRGARKLDDRRCLMLGPSRQLAGRSLQKTSYAPYTLFLSKIIIKQHSAQFICLSSLHASL